MDSPFSADDFLNMLRSQCKIECTELIKKFFSALDTKDGVVQREVLEQFLVKMQGQIAELL